MNKFKDFIYDKSDILIALMILLIAGLLIAWRLGAIVEYPKTLVEEASHTSENAVQESIFDEPEAENGGEATENEGEATEEPEEEPADQPTANTAVWNGGVLASEMTVTVGAGNAASTMVNDYLVSVGLFESYNDYAQTCTAQGLNPEMIKTGTYTFAAGATKADVALKVNRGY